MATDSSAAKAIAERLGLGTQRHIDVQYLWIQQQVRFKRLLIDKIHTAKNPSDMLTNNVNHDTLIDLTSRLGLSYDSGRSELAPQLAMVTRLCRGRTTMCLRYTSFIHRALPTEAASSANEGEC